VAQRKPHRDPACSSWPWPEGEHRKRQLHPSPPDGLEAAGEAKHFWPWHASPVRFRTQASRTPEVLAGSIERVHFTTRERLLRAAHPRQRPRDLVTVGVMPPRSAPGMGDGERHLGETAGSHGQQFKASFLRAPPRHRRQGLEIPGFWNDPGHRADLRQQASWPAFGDHVFEVNRAGRTRPTRGCRASAGWRRPANQARPGPIRRSGARNHGSSCTGHGVGTARAVRIFKNVWETPCGDGRRTPTGWRATIPAFASAPADAIAARLA